MPVGHPLGVQKYFFEVISSKIGILHSASVFG